MYPLPVIVPTAGIYSPLEGLFYAGTVFGARPTALRTIVRRCTLKNTAGRACSPAQMDILPAEMTAGRKKERL